MDRYQALGLPYPDPATMCLGPCEGTGVVPLTQARARELGYGDAWDKAEAEEPTDDGFHFLKCQTCGGLGKRIVRG